ncbi:hypothetical protein Scep_030509 [Stephania cephalantha]|uniref:BSD domain-containing protein n=1 Tax=Stephania cephalantha TaxID=152367 RepID=A0AAP0E7J2_9MAGN
MNFFKSVFSDDPDPQTDPNSPSNPNPNSSINGGGGDGDGGGAWTFGDLLKTVASRSESVIQTYRRDLEEFGSGLKSETALIRDAATRVVKDLPSSIEAAQGSIGSIWKAIDDAETETERDPTNSSSNRSIMTSRFEMQVRAIQSDMDTFAKDPDDLGDFGKWKLGFVVEEKREEIERLIGENGVLCEVYAKAVPELVDDEGFWFRYFYRIDKAKQVEEARADLVRRAVSGEDDDENWSWDVEDGEGDTAKSDRDNADKGSSEERNDFYENVAESGGGSVGDLCLEKKSDRIDRIDQCDQCDQCEVNCGDNVEKLEEGNGGVGVEEVGEEEIGWDEIEDLGNENERRVGGGGGSNRVDVQKRISDSETGYSSGVAAAIRNRYLSSVLPLLKLLILWASKKVDTLTAAAEALKHGCCRDRAVFAVLQNLYVTL